MTNIDIKYETWKNKLLDLGKRNRLLNYRDTARSSVKITYPECSKIYKMLVKDETSLIFPLEIEEGENSFENSNGNIQTNKNNSDLQKVLRNIRSKAKTAIEEQGVNVLYLSFGFLKWTESDSSHREFSSPLVLVPVSLTVESITSPYSLHLHEDEIVVNPTLVYKLENDFGISLPSFEDDGDIDEFLEEVSKCILVNKWSVTRDVGLSLFSFLKINMYADLNNNKKMILANPIVRAISGDTTAVSDIPDGISDYDFDENEKPLNVFQVVDADASQQEAILMAKKGVSFVLQGPPGTGKSQTITNIIAESLADGKKVLFVSEKMAALDVVHRRLSSAGLADFCLVLHSYRANKKSVLEQLGKVLNLSQKKATLTDDAYQKLETLETDRKKLNDYANQIYETVEPLGKSIFEANGIIANLVSYDDEIFAIDDIRNTTKEKYNRYISILNQFSSTIGKMTDDYRNNPWRNCNLTSVTNEFRHDVTARINSVLPKIKVLDEQLATIFSELHLDIPHTISDVDNIITVLKVSESGCRIPTEWILSRNLNNFIPEVVKCKKYKTGFLSLTEELENELLLIKENDKSISLDEIGCQSSATDYLNQKNKIYEFLATSEPYSLWNTDNINCVEKLLSESKNVADEIKSLKDELLVTYEPEVFDVDYKSILQRIKTEYTSFTKIFKQSYKQDKKTIQGLRRDIVKKISDEEMLSLVEKLRKINETKQWYSDNSNDITLYFGTNGLDDTSDYSAYQKKICAFNALNNEIEIIDKINLVFDSLSKMESKLIDHYKFLYHGILSDWESIENSLKWAISFKECISKTKVTDSFVTLVCEDEGFVEVCKRSREKFEESMRSISFEYRWFISHFDSDEEFNSAELSSLYRRFESSVNGLYLLEEWIDFKSARANCVEEGLGEFVALIEQRNIPASSIVPVFRKRFYRLWLDAVLPEYPAVLSFRRKNQEQTISEFNALDRIQFEIAKARIRGKLINDLPSLEHFTNGTDEISILKRELSKQRRIMPIRRLFKEIPNLLLTIKPCLMMSPLSVSLFLEAETYKFDIVIFDEASQVCTENAIGAISRGKQVVIAGDSKQLPPTNFFQATITDSDFDTDEDEDDFDDSDAYESILDEANMLPERTLRWHYRSRHESLIAFSNAKIYKNSLVTFPSNIEQVADNGVEYVYVPDGFYDRGGKRGNIVEANKIADLVFEHFQKHPNRSLGVIAFGEVQQLAIETVLRDRRIKDQSFESFFSEDKEEAFFVKNLENVQGDERDTIIFSIGYAKDVNGVFRMNFGPLSKSGGERRLNVAITRAKYNVKLVGSIMPTDIDVDKISSEGPKLLRSYIDFAINGQSVLDKEITESDIVEHDSPFEEAVYKFLDRKGYKLGTQVGCSGYRIDMAVKHPTLSGIYVLGIECDGAAYHSARTARERDRLRQDVLENMGWKIYRIWSTDWIKDPVTEGNKLIEAIETAITNYGIDDTFLGLNNKDEKKDINDDNFINVEEKKTIEEGGNPYGFEQFKETDFSSLPRNSMGHLNLSDCIKAVIENEYPIHYELLCQRLAPLFGNVKATVAVRRAVDEKLPQLKREITQKNDFFYPKGYTNIPIRVPNSRNILHISTEELAQAMLIILKTFIGPTRESLIAETTRVYGFSRAGQNIQLAMSDAITKLLRGKRIIEVEGKLKLK